MRRRQGFLWNTKTYILGTFNITILFSIKFFANHYLWNAISAKVGIYFHDGRSRFYYERLRFSLWQVEIFVMKVWDFLMNGRDFRDDRSRFSWWKVGIFMMTGRDFHDDRWRFFFLFLVLLKHICVTPGTFLEMGWVQDFIFLFLMLIKEIRWRRESKIPLRNPSGGKFLLRPSAGFDKLLGRNVFRALSNFYYGTFLKK